MLYEYNTTIQVLCVKLKPDRFYSSVSVVYYEIITPPYEKHFTVKSMDILVTCFLKIYISRYTASWLTARLWSKHKLKNSRKYREMDNKVFLVLVFKSNS